MPLDYDAIIQELSKQESELLNEIETVKAGRTAIIRLKRAQEMREAVAPTASKRFADFGAKKAVMTVLGEANGTPMTTSEIYDAMVAGGWQTGSDKPAANVSATLSQMRDKEVTKVGEAWRLTLVGKVAHASNDEITVSLPARDSLASTVLYPNASQRPLKQ